MYILNSKIPTDPGRLKIRHSHRFVAVVIQFFNSMDRVHGVVHGPGPSGGPWTPVHSPVHGLYTSANGLIDMC